MTNGIAINGILLDNENLIRFMVRGDEPKNAIITVKKVANSQVLEIFKNKKETGNVLELIEDGVTVSKNDKIVNMFYEFAFNKHMESFEERLIIVSEENF